MHVGSIESELTAAGRVYAYLAHRRGSWVDSWRLTLDTQTTAISTRISEIRHQLPPTEDVEVNQIGRKFYYRLVKVVQPVGEQLAFKLLARQVRPLATIPDDIGV